MIVVNYAKMHENMETYMDKVINDFETVIVTRKDKNVVIISEDAYNNLIENAYLTREKVNYDWLMKSKGQAIKGETQVHSLIED